MCAMLSHSGSGGQKFSALPSCRGNSLFYYVSCLLARGLTTTKRETDICCKRLAGFEEGSLDSDPGYRGGSTIVDSF